MKPSKKHFISTGIAVAFITLAIASKTVVIQNSAFKHDNSIEKDEKANYLVRNDGTKIYGTKIGWQTGAIVKDKIWIDDKDFKISEIKGFMRDNEYHARVNSLYAIRVVHGKINIYTYDVSGGSISPTSNAPNNFTSSNRTLYYYQKNENDEPVRFTKLSDLKSLVSDCSLSMKMLDLNTPQLQRTVREDPDYLNKVVEIYNNECKTVK